MNSEVAWKDNWEDTKKHFVDWWRQEGLVLTVDGHFPANPPHEEIEDPGYRPNGYGDEAFCSNPKLRAEVGWYGLSRQLYPCDNMPLAGLDLGPGTLSVYLGARPVFDHTVWYEPWMTDEDPSRYPPLRFDPEQYWWKTTEATAKACAGPAKGKYIVACPDLIENIDTLAAVRGTHQVMLDISDRPEWVEAKLAEINQAWFEVYQRIYDAIRLSDGSCAFEAYRIWGPGKTAKLQSDASAMLSPAMFDNFVVPALTEQCEWLDYSLFHLDGSQCLCHLDSLLGIEALDGVEWTPDPTVPPGGDPCWYNLYRRILDAGKSVQAVCLKAEEVVPMLDAVGGKGVYIFGVSGITGLREAEKLMAAVEQYR